jgi:hypothetical protein
MMVVRIYRCECPIEPCDARASASRTRGTAGYDQSVGEDVAYLTAIQAAEASVNAARGNAMANSAASSYGGMAAGTSDTSDNKAAPHVSNDGIRSVYFGH